MHVDGINGKELRDARFELWVWQCANSGSFSSMLYDLIGKADQWNRQKIRRAFPEFVCAFEEWQQSNNPTKFLEECHRG